MPEAVRTEDRPAADEAAMVARVSRYSSLRGVERTLLPSVRRRKLLPTMQLGADLLGRLQDLLGSARRLRAGAQMDRDAVLVQLGGVDELLGRYSERLKEMVRDTPVMQLRSTLPSVIKGSRLEVAALLDLLLEDEDALSIENPPHRIDFLITLLSRQRTGGVATLHRDPAGVSAEVRERCAEMDRSSDLECEALARVFRDAAIELLSQQDLDPIVTRMRRVKGDLGPLLFDREVLRAVVAYNIAAENRFHQLFELEHQKDRALERTLHALGELDSALKPDPLIDDPAGEAPGMRALEEAVRERLSHSHHEADMVRRLAESIAVGRFDGREIAALVDPGSDLSNVLTRAAAVVGLAMPDPHSSIERLHDTAPSCADAEADHIKELDEVLLAAIQTLSRLGQTEQAARLARTRMRFIGCGG